MNNLEINFKTFDSIKHIDENNREYWSARELMEVLEYSKWENFHKVIKQAKLSCRNSDIDIIKQFPGARKLSTNVNCGKREIIDYHLSRYACYLIARY